jgi:hypothetical protein
MHALSFFNSLRLKFLRYRLRLYIMFGFVWELRTPLIFRVDYVFAIVEWTELLGLGANGNFELTSVRVLRYLWLVLQGKRC